MDESGTDGAECIRKVMSGRMQVPSGPWLMLGIWSLSVLVFYEILLVSVLMYGSKTMLWRKKERSRVKAVQMDNLRGLLSIRRMDRVLNAQIRELCRVRKGLDERIDEGILRLLSHVERVRITKSLCRSVCW